jgi:hypothetical protein
MADRDAAPPEDPRPSPEDEADAGQPGSGPAGGGGQHAAPPQHTGSRPPSRPGSRRPDEADGAGGPTYDDGDSRVFLEGDG